MSRLIMRIEGIVLVYLIGRYNGDIAEAPGIKGGMTLVASVPRYRVFQGNLSNCTLMVSQGTELADPGKINITVVGIADENDLKKTISEFLKKTGIEETDLTEENMRAYVDNAKKLAVKGFMPAWMIRKPPTRAG